MRVPRPSEFLLGLDAVLGLSRSFPMIGTEPLTLPFVFTPADDPDLGLAVGGDGGPEDGDKPPRLGTLSLTLRGFGFSTSLFSGIDIEKSDGRTLISFFPA